jgi:probable phosphoglycerate mutase
MLSVFFTRHGQTDHSLNNRFCGSTDAPLNATGHAMAEALGARYGSEGFAAIYASPMQRTRATADAIARRANVPVTIDERLREIAYGEWEARAESDVARDDGERFHAWAAHPAYVAPPGGETAIAIAARALAALDEVRARHRDGKILVVSHKATLRVLLCALLGIDVDLFRARLAQRVAAVSIIEFRSTGPLLQLLNDVSHLPHDLQLGEGS